MWWRITCGQSLEPSSSFPHLTLEENKIDEVQKNRLWYQWHENAVQQSEDMLNKFLSNPSSKQEWHLVPADRIIKIWQDFAKNHFVRDEKGLDQIAHIMIQNTQRLFANTVMAGHTEYSPENYAENYDIQWNEEHKDMFADHIEDESGAWRISDYALSPLIEDSQQLMAETDSTRKLLIIDRMLNRVHARSDIAALFIEGGVKTLNHMFSG